jgi:hypothetical protein
MILEKTFNKSIKVSKAVVFWNYFDHLHLDVVHRGYEAVDVLYEKDGCHLTSFKVKAPFIPFFYFRFPMFSFMQDEDTFISYSFQFGVITKVAITVKEMKKDYCEIIMNYKFDLPGFKIILYPIFNFLIGKWNEQAWVEDLPVKLRRQMVLRMGFKDFYGLPDKVEDRFYNDEIEVNLPIKRPRNSVRDRHPFADKGKDVALNRPM